MSVLTLLLVIVILGVVLYLVETYVPMSPPIKVLMRVVVVIFVILWLLQITGVQVPSVPRFR